VNLIGEHTDYNDGFVFPMAIDRAVWIALRPRSDGRVVAVSLNFDETREFDLAKLTKKDSDSWIEYLKGTAWALQGAGHVLKGFDGVVAGDVPLGAGLSSSASIEMATARAFAAVSDVPWQPAPMALLGQKAENKWVGVNCGIMDQLISAAGVEDKALLIDCRSLETQAVPLPRGTVVVVLDTATRRGLVDSAYNERRAQCEAAAKLFGVKALRDVTSAQLAARAAELDPVTLRRARHVVSEDERTLAAAEAMRANDAARLGTLMNDSHESLRHDFEVTNDGLNVMADEARRAPGCFGARMTGAGFGGCAVALVAAFQSEAFVRQVDAGYRKATGLDPKVYVCRATNGAEIVA
ncbi:MAG TPA: galactokinase, partial [Vicinamibacteria bacterium]|nr:galactokinase [Vicinamibacteria bacterium]